MSVALAQPIPMSEAPRTPSPQVANHPMLHFPQLQALVFVPTPELALQVARELKWLIYVAWPKRALAEPRSARPCEVLSGGSDKVCWFNPQVPQEIPLSQLERAVRWAKAGCNNTKNASDRMPMARGSRETRDGLHHSQEIACNVLLSRANLWDAVRQDTAILVCTPGRLGMRKGPCLCNLPKLLRTVAQRVACDAQGGQALQGHPCHVLGEQCRVAREARTRRLFMKLFAHAP